MKVRDMVLCALFAALMAVCAWICVPLGGMTFTLQTFGIFLALLTLGGKRGFLSVVLYLLLGAVGLPVFSGFQGGIGTFFGVTGGYLWGFFGASLVYWLLTGLFGDRARLIAVLLGILICYACGAGWMAFVMLRDGSSGGVWQVLTVFVLPYLLPDGLKLALAWTVAKRLKKQLR